MEVTGRRCVGALARRRMRAAPGTSRLSRVVVVLVAGRGGGGRASDRARRGGGRDGVRSFSWRARSPVSRSTTRRTSPTTATPGIDLFLGAPWQGRGLGVDTVRTLARHLLAERGHHRLTIDPGADNAAAIRCYERVGFRRVGVMREYWRDGDGVWRDGLLMDLLADELPTRQCPLEPTQQADPRSAPRRSYTVAPRDSTAPRVRPRRADSPVPPRAPKGRAGPCIHGNEESVTCLSQMRANSGPTL